MALPINRPQNSSDDPNDVTEDQLLKASGRLPRFQLDPADNTQPDREFTEKNPVNSLRGGSLDQDEETLEEAKEAYRQKFGKATRASNGLAIVDPNQVSTALTSDDLIHTPWEHYARLQPKVVEVKNWLQNVLKEQNRNGDVAQARAKRNHKYTEVRQLIDELLVKYFAANNIVRGADAPVLMDLVKNEILGLGPIEPLWLDPRISEIMVNGPSRIRVEIKGKLIDVPGARFRDADHLLEVCQQILAPVNKVIDVSHPYGDGRLSDGSRVNITHPDIGPAGPYLTIRRFPDTVFSMKQFVEEYNSMSPELAKMVANFIHHGLSTIVVGGTGTGKTSMLNALSGCIPPDERVITIEDNLELRLHKERDIVALEARASYKEDGKGAVTIRDLVRNALRMRPDRIIVGEVRDGSAYDMLQAMNTGHDGSMTTVHANDAYGSVERLVNLISEVGEIDSNRALSLIAGGVDIILTIDRYEDGSRRCSGVYEVPNRVTSTNGTVTLNPIPLIEFEQDGLDENDKIIGHWEIKGDTTYSEHGLSDSMVRKHRLHKKRNLSLEEIYEFSEQHTQS